jgi:hypothetical protein
MADCNSALVLQRRTAVLPLIFSPQSFIRCGTVGTLWRPYLWWMGLGQPRPIQRHGNASLRNPRTVSCSERKWFRKSMPESCHKLRHLLSCAVYLFTKTLATKRSSVEDGLRLPLSTSHNTQQQNATALYVHCHTSLLSHVKSCQVLECRHKEVTNKPVVRWFLGHPVYYRILQGQNGWLKTSTTATCKSFTGSPKFQRNGVITTAHRLNPTDILSVYKILITFQTTVF